MYLAYTSKSQSIIMEFIRRTLAETREENCLLAHLLVHAYLARSYDLGKHV